jgi:HAMP domain-containing protein
MKKKKMDSLYNYITDPWTLVSFVVFVFWLWATWSNLNGRIKSLEEKTDEIDITKIEIKLAEIQKDLQRIRDELDKSSAN